MMALCRQECTQPGRLSADRSQAIQSLGLRLHQMIRGLMR